ncbi:DNA polymerase III epsilon subunit-like protein [Ensifer adhaerens]|uniref:DNA polymerase III epsilon subunit-like protein n=1 Tax=Ensifer adhaerens TaxID=106592 RepID=A0ACC5SYW1_ENSAD|nr:3'-5' exonuclease [Ensifer adhaerens]MBP1874052.1 DNA polymerase III epsilon subunit-like protein [Ensifer adhaerens]
MTEKREEIFISVDIEAAGPIPPDYSMLSLGCCLVDDPDISFYVEFKPISENFIPDAMAVSGFDLDRLKETGTNPEEAMRRLDEWVATHSGGGKPIFVGFNAPFDWAFVNYYFLHFLKKNPFGIGAVDIKAMYMGATGSSWDATRSSQFPVEKQKDDEKHDALADARHQAKLFRYVRDLRIQSL